MTALLQAVTERCTMDEPVALNKLGWVASAATSGALRPVASRPDIERVFINADTLQRVIPVGQSENVGGVVVTIFSMELFEDGQRIRMQVELASDHPDRFTRRADGRKVKSADRMLRGSLICGFTVSDDCGTVYRSQFRCSGSNDRLDATLTTEPALSSIATTLYIAAPKLLWHDIFHADQPDVTDVGPWEFVIPLE
jgi:hypothetical protein